MPDTRLQIGQHIRDHVLPAGISVTAAAKRLGVGRPALSNLLNGRASLSEQMALRLERAFGANREELLELQRSQVRPVQDKQEREVAVRGYVPSFLSVKARDIEQWASRIEARELLAVLLRKLVHETGRDLTRVDFPGFDNSQRPGWDGVVEAETATAWVPAGLSGWEFGTNKDVAKKAETDYGNRLSLPPEERARCTLVFVTPRNWSGKSRWVQEKAASGDGWKAVRAYDASDLEQWLEDAIATPLWLAEQCLDSPMDGIQTLHRCWREWSQVSDPPMSRRIFEPNVRTSLPTFERWLNTPPDRPFIVASDSIGETLAFVTCLFEAALDSEAEDDLLAWQAKQEMAAVFESPETFQRLAESPQPFIAIAGNPEVEKALASFWSRHHCIVHTVRNAVSARPDVALELLSFKDIDEALDDMGVPEHERPRLGRQSGRSPTILRRLLSKVPTIHSPPWSADPERARSLMPMALVGAWKADREADQEVLATLANRPYDELEQAIADLLQLDDSPLWSVGNHRGVASKVDALYAVAPRVTATEVEDFLVLAEWVLSESDPALELPQDQRWAAAIHEKLRDHSDALREGVRETVVMLGVHAENLFGQRLAIDVKGKVLELVRAILDPFTAETLESQERDLPAYAEVAPDILLRLLETDLANAEPEVLALMGPASSAPFEHCPRTGLLWALECIAWNPTYVARACVVLAKLAQVPIQDNWANTPVGSLSGILRSWMPQTSASIEERIRLLEMIVQRFPNMAWKMCIGEIAQASRFAMDAYRPSWNGDATGAGGVVSTGEIVTFIHEAWRLLMSWEHDVSTLGDLVEHVQDLDEERQRAIWRLVDDWLEAEPNDRDRAVLRERIRRCCLTRRGRRGQQDDLVKRAHDAFDKLQPTDPVNRHAWLFANGWVDESWDEIKDDSDNWEARDARVDAWRRDAIDEVWSARNMEGVLALVDRGNAAETVGRYVGLCDAIGDDSAAEMLRACLHDKSRDESVLDAFMLGLIGSLADPAQSDLLRLANRIAAPYAERLFRCAPFHASTWRLLDKLPDEVRRGYWQHVLPYGRTFSSDECREVIDRLLEARRPRAAFASMKLQWTNIDSTRLIRLLSHVATVFDEPTGHFRVDPYDLSNALDALDASPEVTLGQMALLEFAFIEALEHSEHGIPNLERAVEQSPSIFVQAVTSCYLRDDGTEDVEAQSGDQTRQKNAASTAYRFLSSIKRIPGTEPDGTVNAQHLQRWVHEARTMLAEVGRKKSGDEQIGVLLSQAPREVDGMWPCTAVCTTMEAIPTDEVAAGFIRGKCNSRGVVVGDPAPQDRALAKTYRGWSERRHIDFPFVGNVLLRLAKRYESDAEMWERQTIVDKRLGQWA